ncbi:DUF421 domain-containing protein [Ramlibacter rhizophilus]|uniref:DUF421 domain-containing protein n=1 Tax=Ramlibacter rhizophilus TaxID=1781167 RepID=A0A4Z0BZQ7_9BURK|nr:YetF domain-containing protein [Ramlibacter rhizophilus]TFZ04733.1 DUF421 domain-containing protein [Ramlibacter rhizophilus]
MWFDSWEQIGRVLMVGLAAYASLVLVLRTSGKRTLSKLNAFDLVVTVAMGSTLATALLSKDVAFAEALAAYIVLAGGQWVVARLSVRSARFAHLVRSAPRLLVYQGRLLGEALDDERITHDELLSALRAGGFGRVEDAAAVVLESDGSISVLGTAPPVGAGTLQRVVHPAES